MKIKQARGDKPRKAITATSSDTIGDIVYQLEEYSIGAVIVSDDGVHINGIISERDIVRHIAREQEGTLRIPVGDLMTVNVQTATDEDDVDAVLKTMTEGRFRHMPILSADGEIVGMVSLADLITAKLSELTTGS